MPARKTPRRLSPRAIAAWAAVSVVALVAFMVEIDATSATSREASRVVGPALK